MNSENSRIGIILQDGERAAAESKIYGKAVNIEVVELAERHDTAESGIGHYRLEGHKSSPGCWLNHSEWGELHRNECPAGTVKSGARRKIRSKKSPLCTNVKKFHSIKKKQTKLNATTQFNGRNRGR